MKAVRILVHTQGSANDAHLPAAMKNVCQQAKDEGIDAVPVKSLADIKARLLLPIHDHDAADAALSADSTTKLLAIVRDLEPIQLRNPVTSEIESLKSPLAAILPSAQAKHPFVLTDAGAHATNTPFQVAAGALLCGSFWRVVYGKQHPRYGIYGYGEEESKLPPDAREVYHLLKLFNNRVVRIVESKEIFAGDAAEILVVRNGEIGNTILKTAEAVISGFGAIIREEIKAEFQTKVGGALAKPAFTRTKARLYHIEAHGAFLLGSRRPFMKHHGRMGGDELLDGLRRLARHTRKGVIEQSRQDFLTRLEEQHPDWLPANQ